MTRKVPPPPASAVNTKTADGVPSCFAGAALLVVPSLALNLSRSRLADANDVNVNGFAGFKSVLAGQAFCVNAAAVSQLGRG